MIINFESIRELKYDLSELLGLSAVEIDNIISSYSDEQTYRKISRIIREEPKQQIEKIALYHFTRRLKNENYDKLYSLPNLLLEKSAFSDFFSKHGITFVPQNNRLNIKFRTSIYDFEYLAKRPEYANNPYILRLRNRFDDPAGKYADPFINGFLFYLTEDHYNSGEQYLNCPELISDIDHVLSEILEFHEIDLARDFVAASKPFCALCFVPICDIWYGTERKPVAVDSYICDIFEMLRDKSYNPCVYINNSDFDIKVDKWISVRES